MYRSLPRQSYFCHNNWSCTRKYCAVQEGECMVRSCCCVLEKLSLSEIPDRLGMEPSTRKRRRFPENAMSTLRLHSLSVALTEKEKAPWRPSPQGAKVQVQALSAEKEPQHLMPDRNYWHPKLTAICGTPGQHVACTCHEEGVKVSGGVLTGTTVYVWLQSKVHGLSHAPVCGSGVPWSTKFWFAS